MLNAIKSAGREIAARFREAPIQSTVNAIKHAGVGAIGAGEAFFLTARTLNDVVGVHLSPLVNNNIPAVAITTVAVGAVAGAVISFSDRGSRILRRTVTGVSMGLGAWAFHRQGYGETKAFNTELGLGLSLLLGYSWNKPEDLHGRPKSVRHQEPKANAKSL